jgi:hypothetical protein
MKSTISILLLLLSTDLFAIEQTEMIGNWYFNISEASPEEDDEFLIKLNANSTCEFYMRRVWHPDKEYHLANVAPKCLWSISANTLTIKQGNERVATITIEDYTSTNFNGMINGRKAGVKKYNMYQFVQLPTNYTCVKRKVQRCNI